MSANRPALSDEDVPFDDEPMLAWLKVKLSKLRAEGRGKVALRCESPSGGDYACAVCGGCVGNPIMCHILAAGPLLEFERPTSTDGSGERVVGNIICWRCARFLDPVAYGVYDEKVLGEHAPLAELNNSQAALWNDPALAQRLAAQGLRFLDEKYREIISSR